jgi:hypothetical protein
MANRETEDFAVDHVLEPNTISILPAEIEDVVARAPAVLPIGQGVAAIPFQPRRQQSLIGPDQRVKSRRICTACLARLVSK